MASNSLHTNPVQRPGTIFCCLGKRKVVEWKEVNQRRLFLQVSPLGLEIIHRTGSYTLSLMMKWPKKCQKSQMICNSSCIFNYSFAGLAEIHVENEIPQWKAWKTFWYLKTSAKQSRRKPFRLAKRNLAIRLENITKSGKRMKLVFGRYLVKTQKIHLLRYGKY